MRIELEVKIKVLALYLGSTSPSMCGEGKNKAREAVKQSSGIRYLGRWDFCHIQRSSKEKSFLREVHGRKNSMAIYFPAPSFLPLPTTWDSLHREMTHTYFQIVLSSLQHLLEKPDPTSHHVAFHPCLQVEGSSAWLERGLSTSTTSA